MPGAEVTTFGYMPDGREVKAVRLSNSRGLLANVITYGATLQSVVIPDRDGQLAEVLPGFADMAGYLAKREYFGATVGRYANRIAGGRFVLAGRLHCASRNERGNSLHGGEEGFDRLLWEIAGVRGDPAPAVTLRLISHDGDQGYPGTLTVDATFSLDDSDRLGIEYRATTDRTTIVNITNHAYWTLAGEGSERGAMDAQLMIPAHAYLPTDAEAIPVGELRPVADTAFDFRTPRAVGERVRDAEDAQIVIGRGYDHDFVLADAITRDERLMATLEDPGSGRGFELWSNQPGLQFYSGNFLDGTTIGKGRRLYRTGDAVVLEPQLHPDTPNRPHFGSAVLEPGQVYRNVMSFRFFSRRRLT